MGGSYYSRDDYSVRASVRSSTARDKGIPLADAVFAYSADIHSGKTAAVVHASLNPFKVVRESRDSDAHPISVPISVFLDTTGSMADVPRMIQEKLSHLMGCFLDDKASGKKYLGEGYPAIMIGAVDDYDAMTGKGEGCLQAGQFESGIEIDDNLTNLWLTRRGGGTYQESYELGMYFLANKTKHDHWDKRNRKGYAFFIGDEHAYDVVDAGQIKNILGDVLQSDVRTTDVIKQLKERYHVFFVIPNMTQYYNDVNLEKYWVGLLGQQNVLKLDDPGKICELIAGAVALCEEHVGIDEINADLGKMGALVHLAKGTIATHDATGLPAIAGSGGSKRL